MGNPAHQAALKSTTLEKSHLLAKKNATLERKKTNPPLNVHIKIVLATLGLPSVSFFNIHSHGYTIVFQKVSRSQARARLLEQHHGCCRSSHSNAGSIFVGHGLLQLVVAGHGLSLTR